MPELLTNIFFISCDLNSQQEFKITAVLSLIMF